MVTPLTENEVTFTVEFYPDDTTLAGNVLASGDANLDLEAEELVANEIEAGNDFAWCQIVVTAKWRRFVGTDTLCGVSVLNHYCEDPEASILADYVPEIKEIALEALNSEIESTFDDISDRLEK